MKFRDLNTQYKNLKEDIDQGIAKVLEDCNFISGSQVGELETMLAEYVGVKYCITCANGTDALSLALMAWKVGEGDAVFVPDFTFFSSGEVVSFQGATPVFTDVCEETFNMSPESLEMAIQNVIEEGILTPKVIVAVDLFGLPADYSKIKAIASKYNLYILEDGAQGFGGSIQGKRACSFGDIATTSFFPAKPLGCYGDGGAVFTDDDALADYIRSIRIHGKGTCKYDNVRIGMNSRLDTIQAAVLIPKQKAFASFELEAVNQKADTYTRMLGDCVEKPVIPSGFQSSWAQYTIKLKNEEERNALQAYLKGFDIPTMVYYPKPMHQQEAFQGKMRMTDCSVTESLCKRVLALPMSPYIKEEDIQLIVKHIKTFLEK